MEGNGFRTTALRAVANRASTTRRTNRRSSPLATRRNNRSALNAKATSAPLSVAAAATANSIVPITNLTNKISYTNLKTGRRYKLLEENPKLGRKINGLLDELRTMKAHGEIIDDRSFIQFLVYLISNELSE